jgi:hypothetical protein
MARSRLAAEPRLRTGAHAGRTDRKPGHSGRHCAVLRDRSAASSASAEALAAAGRGDNYIVSTGTGSGKSLTYLVPIFDMILRDDPARHSVRAQIVYPMNALINSQVGALSAFRAANWPACPVRFAQYTGQTREEVRQQLLQDPPHIQLRDARVHADPAAGAGAGRRDATGVALPVRRRAACLSRPPRGGCGDAATSPAPANGATQPTICRYIGDNRDRRRSCDPTRADRRGRKPLVRCPGRPGECDRRDSGAGGEGASPGNSRSAARGCQNAAAST